MNADEGGGGGKETPCESSQPVLLLLASGTDVVETLARHAQEAVAHLQELEGGGFRVNFSEKEGATLGMILHDERPYGGEEGRVAVDDWLHHVCCRARSYAWMVVRDRDAYYKQHTGPDSPLGDRS